MRSVHTIQYALLLQVLLLFCERGFAFTDFEHETPYSGSVMQEQWMLDWTFAIFDDDPDMDEITVTGSRVRFLGFAEMHFTIAELIMGGCAAYGGVKGGGVAGSGVGALGAAGGAMLGAGLCYFLGVTAEQIAEDWSESNNSAEPPWAECDGVLYGFAGAPLCVPPMPE
jgi:hypothetical protein